MPKKKPFHYWLPFWMIREISERFCSQCNTPVTKQDIIAVGVREHDGKNTVFVEHACSSCEHRAITSMGGNKIGTVEEMCFVLLDEIQKRTQLEKTLKQVKKTQHPAISNKEVKDMVDFMSSCEEYDQFMKYIGSSPEDTDEKSTDQN